MILVIVLYALFALTFAVAKKALWCSSPLVLAWARTGISALCLLPIHWLMGGKFSKFKRQELPYLIAYTITIIITIVGANYALMQIPSAKVALIYTFSPLITALISYFVYNTKLSYHQLIGLLIGLVGIITIIFSDNEAIDLSLHLPSLPELVLLIAITAYSVSWFLVQPLITKAKYSSIYINGLTSLITAIVCYLAIVANQIPIPTTIDFWYWSFIQAIVSSVICYSLYMYLLKYYSANFLSFAYFIEPFFAAMYGWILLGEVPSTNFWAASVLITLGLVFFYKGELVATKGLSNK